MPDLNSITVPQLVEAMRKANRHNLPLANPVMAAPGRFDERLEALIEEAKRLPTAPLSRDELPVEVSAALTSGEACKACTMALCCRQINLPLDCNTYGDLDWLRFYVAHEGVSLFLLEAESSNESDGEGFEPYEGFVWRIMFQTVCSHLQPDGMCGNYQRRMDICRTHSTGWCEFQEPNSLTQHPNADPNGALVYPNVMLVFRTLEDLDAWIANRFPSFNFENPGLMRDVPLYSTAEAESVEIEVEELPVGEQWNSLIFRSVKMMQAGAVILMNAGVPFIMPNSLQPILILANPETDMSKALELVDNAELFVSPTNTKPKG